MPHVRRNQEGFTLIELLVVVALIGALAAIALPAFLGQTRGAGDARAKSEVATAVRTIEAFSIEAGTYSATPAQLVALEGGLTGAINLTVSGTENTFRISVGTRRGSTFAVERTAGGDVRSCTPVGIGGCDADGAW